MPTKASAAPAPPGAPAPTPYEEHHHYRFRHPDVKNTVKARQRSFRAIQVERDNTQYPAQAERAQARARVEVPRPRRRAQPQAQVSANARPARRTEASTEWDDGGGRSSSTARDGERRKIQDPSSQAGGKTQTKERRARHWPPPRFPRGVYAENTEVMRQNASLQRRLVNQYARVEGLSARQRGQRTARGWTRAVGQTTGGVRPSSPEPGANHRRDGQVRQHRRPEDPDRRSVQRHRAVDLLRSGRPQATGAPRLPRPLLLREVVRRVRGDGRDDATRGDRLRDRVPVEATEGALVAAREGAGRVVGGQQAHEARAVLMRRMARADLFDNARTLNASNSSGDDHYEDDFEDEGDAPVRSAAGTTRTGALTMDEIRRRVETCRTRERIDDEERRRERREIEKLGRDEAVAAAAAAHTREEIAAEGRAEADADATDADATEADATGVKK